MEHVARAHFGGCWGLQFIRSKSSREDRKRVIFQTVLECLFQSEMPCLYAKSFSTVTPVQIDDTTVPQRALKLTYTVYCSSCQPPIEFHKKWEGSVRDVLAKPMCFSYSVWILLLGWSAYYFWDTWSIACHANQAMFFRNLWSKYSQCMLDLWPAEQIRLGGYPSLSWRGHGSSFPPRGTRLLALVVVRLFFQISCST